MTHLSKDDINWCCYLIARIPRLAPLAGDAGIAHLYLLARGWDYLPCLESNGRYCLWLPKGSGYVHLPQAAAVHFEQYLQDRYPVFMEHGLSTPVEVIQ